MPDPSVSRGKFLRSLGKSVTGMAFGKGITTAAQILASRVASVSPAGIEPDATSKALATADPFIHSGPADGNRIALTFDDGPTPGVTDRILDELSRRHLHATFFMIGKNVVAAPELARRVLAEGHEIGNHTFTHPKLNTLPDRQAVAEIEKTEEAFVDLLNYKAKWFRPPCGALRKNQAGIPHGKGLGIAFWSVDSRDWSQPGEAEIADIIVSQTQPGAIILCHDMHSQTANAIGGILDRLLERGFNFVTVSSLLGQPTGVSLTI